jgi:hypothetical protein
MYLLPAELHLQVCTGACVVVGFAQFLPLLAMQVTAVVGFPVLELPDMNAAVVQLPRGEWQEADMVWCPGIGLHAGALVAAAQSNQECY